jgi:hypothetical protein
LDLNTKIAERRAERQAELAREQVAEIKRRHQEEQAQAALRLEQDQLRQAEEKAIEESVQKEADRRIRAIEDRLHGRPEPEEYESISEEARKKVDAHIRSLATQRMTKGEQWKLGLLVFGCIIAFFMAWWVGAGMLFWVCLYSSKVIDRHEEKIRTEIRKARPE